MTTPTLILRHWQFTSKRNVITPVLPDGCRDVIVKTDSRGEPLWFISALATTTQQVACGAGQRFIGFRLHPAARIDEENLLPALSRYEGNENALRAQLEEFVQLDRNLLEALESLGEARHISVAAQQVGVSERTLERWVKHATGYSPSFWKNLARARRTARQLDSQQPLIEVAVDNGYADQAHMTREFRKWFAATPKELSGRSDLCALIHEPGYY